MKAMILAAGRGERMRPLTDTCPKPLLKVGGIALIEHHLHHLQAAGITEIVINYAWLGEQIKAALGDGHQYGVDIRYSAECADGLETAGGIATALPLLGSQPFLVVNGDVLTDIDFGSAPALAAMMQQKGDLAHLWLVCNPDHHPQGDFDLSAQQRVLIRPATAHQYTFSGVGIYNPMLFTDILPNTRAKLAPLLHQAINLNQVSGQWHQGLWLDVGTIARLKQAKDYFVHNRHKQ